jgi:hypothetical protein
MGELSHTLLDVAIAPLDLAESQEKDESNWGLQQLQHAVHQDPISQWAIAEATWTPVHGQEDAARYGYQHTRDAAEEHHYLDKPCGLLWILLDHIQ